jgi:hypothetical protein
MIFFMCVLPNELGWKEPELRFGGIDPQECPERSEKSRLA